MNVLYNMYDTLVARDRSGKLVPGLAESWQSIDATTWELKLRKGVTFHNGEEFERPGRQVHCRPDPRSGHEVTPDHLSEQRQEAQIVDPYTVRIVTKTPDPFITEYLQVVPIISSRYIQQAGAGALASGANGTGPFKFVELDPLRPSDTPGVPRPLRGAPKIGRVVFRVVPESADARLGAPDRRGRHRGEPAAGQREGAGRQARPLGRGVPSQRGIYVVLDNQTRPLDDKRVRQASTYANNRERSRRAFCSVRRIRFRRWSARCYYGYNEEPEAVPLRPAKAKQLLAEAGYPNGFEITMTRRPAES